MTGAVLTVAEMRAAERSAIAAGTSEWDLMRRAGEGAAEYVWRVAGGRPVTVLCGPGNNGGDGYVIAQCLYTKGIVVDLIAPREPQTEVAQHARTQWLGQTSLTFDSAPAPIIVDALFGYGLSRAPSGEFAILLEKFAASHSFKVAIDVPSMVESDSGSVLGTGFQYDLTLALGAWKRAHFLMPATAMMGEKRLVPIGIEIPSGNASLSQRPTLAPPERDAHKYRRGLLAVIAGAMPGAPLLAAEAAARAGAGYVKLSSTHPHACAPPDIVIEKDPEAIFGDARTAALLIGPGLGRDGAARNLLCRALASSAPKVIDGDALYLLEPAILASVDTSRCIVTPHEGELAALCEAFGISAAGKFDRARELAEETGLTVLAKGPDTILAGCDGETRFFPSGSSWLSIAGTGDVLAGAVASRLAVHGDPFRAAEEGVWLHHAAARIARGPFTASDLARAIGPAYESFM